MNKSAWHGVALGMLAAILMMALAVPSLVGATGRPPSPASHLAEAPAEGPRSLGGSSPLVVPAAAFTSDGVDPDGFDFDFAGGYIDGSGSACLKAPAYLPAGATVVAVWASLLDNAAAGNIAVRLRRVNVYSGDSDVMASVTTVEDSADIQQRGASIVTKPHVDYSRYAYYLTTCLNYTEHKLYSVRIYYDYQIFLPVVLRNY